jgi:hypothetical protein
MSAGKREMRSWRSSADGSSVGRSLKLQGVVGAGPRAQVLTISAPVLALVEGAVSEPDIVVTA